MHGEETSVPKERRRLKKGAVPDKMLRIIEEAIIEIEILELPSDDDSLFF